MVWGGRVTSVGLTSLPAFFQAAGILQYVGTLVQSESCVHRVAWINMRGIFLVDKGPPKLSRILGALIYSCLQHAAIIIA
jgi:hypothetical protein